MVLNEMKTLAETCNILDRQGNSRTALNLEFIAIKMANDSDSPEAHKLEFFANRVPFTVKPKDDVEEETLVTPPKHKFL